MKISIVIPTYNRADLISESLESIEKQTFKDFETIVVDDGSTDNTAELISRYPMDIKYIYSEHNGPSHARNLGMQAAKGEYICYLDSDDLYYPYKLDLQCKLLDAYKDVVMVYTETSAFNNTGYWNEFNLRNYHKSAYIRNNLTYEMLFREKHSLEECKLFENLTATELSKYKDRYFYIGNIFSEYLQNTIVLTSSMMFRRTAIENIGLQNTYFGHFHDLEFALRLCQLGKTAFIDVPTYKLRYHAGQVSTTNRPDGKNIAIRKQQDLLKVAKHHGLKNGSYYTENTVSINRLMSRLCRAVALPLLSYYPGSLHTDKYYPRRARIYLSKCAEFGYPEYLLYLASFTPHLIRRILLRIFSISNKTRN